MATRFFKKAESTWYVKYKNTDGKWKNVSCGKQATASDAEVVRKKYDALELNRRHDICVRIVDTGIIDQLVVYRDTEIPKSRTGVLKSAKSIQRYKAIVNNFIEFLEGIGKEKYSEIKGPDISAFFDTLLKLNRSTSTLSKHREVLNRFYEWSKAKYYCSDNPAKNIASFKRKKSVPRYFSEEELQKIFSAAKGQYKNIFRFLYYTGLRAGELCNLKWVDYIAAERHIVLRVMEGNKTKREEIVPLNNAAMEIIEDQKQYRKTPDAEVYIFTNEAGRQLDDANLYRNLKTIAKNEKIQDAKVHTFRHSCASHMVIKGVSLYVVKDILRHASIRETEIYAHLSKNAVRQGVDTLPVI